MRFVLLFAEAEDPNGDSWSRMSEEAKQAWFAEYAAFADAVRSRGSLLFGEGLAPHTTARTVHGDTVTDGPYAESVEQLGGIVLINVPDEATAVELAKLAPSGYVEVRACVDE